MAVMDNVAFGGCYELSSPVVARWQSPDVEPGSSLAEGTKSSEAGVTGVCEPPSVGAEDQTLPLARAASAEPSLQPLGKF